MLLFLAIFQVIIGSIAFQISFLSDLKSHCINETAVVHEDNNIIFVTQFFLDIKVVLSFGFASKGNNGLRI